MVNAANAKHLAKAKARSRADEDVRRRTIQALMSHPDGRRFLWLLLDTCNVFAQTFSNSPGAFGLMAFAEGRRSIGLALFADVSRWSAGDFIKAMAENSSAKIEDEEDDRSDDD
jgi:hypothetical protein